MNRPLSDQHWLNVHQDKTLLSHLLKKVEQAQGVAIARSGVQIEQLVALQAPARPTAAPGAMHGQVALADDPDAHLDEVFGALP
ncbi:MAG: hypothetical protein WCH37_10670 [Synechococcaceae cyanobacterium ELA182]